MSDIQKPYTAPHNENVHRPVTHDHKQPGAVIRAEQQKSFAEVPGHEFFVPFTKIDGISQAKIFSKFYANVGDTPEGENLTAEQVEGIATFAEYLAGNFCVDREGFDNFTSGPGGFGRLMAIVMGFVGELGKDEI